MTFIRLFLVLAISLSNLWALGEWVVDQFRDE